MYSSLLHGVVGIARKIGEVMQNTLKGGAKGRGGQKSTTLKRRATR
jgi:hypothetical protein